jgi:cell division protein FtsN
MSQAGSEKELILGNKQLVSLFFVVVALCGVFFAMGYMVRGNSLKGSLSTPPAADSNAAPADPVKRQQPEQPSATEPVPASDVPPSTAPATSDPQAAGAPAAETRPAQDTPASPIAAPMSVAAKPEERPAGVTDGGSIYVVQVAALARADAESTARTLREQHLPATVASSSKEGLFRVLVGPYHLTTDVANAKARLKTLGFADTIVQKQ